MRVPIGGRLLCCAQLVSPGALVYDVGCDHGYLGIYLLQQGIARHVLASDLRPKPLQRARENAAAYGCTDIAFCCCPGLRQMDGTEGDTVVIAGMGGDSIARILGDCPWIQSPRYTLILQPQSSGNDLRRYLGNAGFCIELERLAQEGGFVYSIMRCRYGSGVPLSPGEQYLSRPLLSGGGELLPLYVNRILHGLRRAVDGLRRSTSAEDRQRLFYYETALREVEEMIRQNDHCSGCL